MKRHASLKLQGGLTDYLTYVMGALALLTVLLSGLQSNVAYANTNVCQIGTTKYTSLSEALVAAEGGDTITLLSNVTGDYNFNKSGITTPVTLDLNNHTMTNLETCSPLLIKNGTISNNARYVALSLREQNAKVTLQNCRIDGCIRLFMDTNLIINNSDIYGELDTSTSWNNTITINSGSIVSNSSPAISSYGQRGTVNIRNTVNIHGGTIRCTGAAKATVWLGSGDILNMTGGQIIAPETNSSASWSSCIRAQDSDITISGGTIQANANTNATQLAILDVPSYAYDLADAMKPVSEGLFTAHNNAKVKVLSPAKILSANGYGVFVMDNIPLQAEAGTIDANIPVLRSLFDQTWNNNYENDGDEDFSSVCEHLSVSPQTCFYDSTPKTPEVTLTNCIDQAYLNSQYDVSYSNNTNPGTATVLVRGQASYMGENYISDLSLSTTFSIVEPSGDFQDVSSNTDHYDDILWLADSHISTGWVASDGTKTFKPYDSVARCDMAAFLFRLARKWGVVDDSWQASPAQQQAFEDVDANTPHAREIWWLASTGISKGWKVDSKYEFRPYAIVTRQDMAAFLFRLAKLANKGGASDSWQASDSSKTRFRDVAATAPDNHHDEVWWLAETGISQGWDVGNGKYEFRGLQDVARCDMAAFLHRMDGLD